MCLYLEQDSASAAEDTPSSDPAQGAGDLKNESQLPSSEQREKKSKKKKAGEKVY